jgi:hypothetical protein
MAYTIAQLAQQITDPQVRTLIDNLLKASALVSHASIIPATHGDIHKYKHWTGLPDIAGRTFGEGFDVSTPTKGVYQLDLQQIGVVHEEDQRVVDTSNYVNPTEFFDEHAPAYYAAMGQAIATAIFTGSADNVLFNNLQTVATANSNTIDAGGSGSGRTWVYCVKWEPDKTGIVVNPSVVSDFASLVRVSPKNVDASGRMQSRYKDTAAETKQPIYEVGYDSIFNLLNNSAYNVACYYNLENTTDKKPTVANMLRLIDLAKGMPGNTYIYTSRLGRRLLAELKDAKLQMMTTDTNYAVSTLAFDGIPIFLDENIAENN